ncbi:MAG: alpha/beta fold hydrolase [Rhodospirillaceae bacterium]|nr:alpha/beta fold hydrolase [Rhodospirillaceae bacterium]
MATTPDVDRAFIRLAEGLVHYRHAGDRSTGEALPLYMVHAGPGSSAGIAPLVAELARTRFVVAPDTLGNGDSAGPAVKNPDLTYYADSVLRVMDALKIDKADYFGTHTGAHIGVELLLSRPDRFRKVIFDGIGIFPDDLKKQMLENYAPEVAPDDFGRQFVWAWHFVRDQSLHFPYFLRDPQHRLQNSMPPAEALHRSVTEVLKALTTYHNGYRAVFRHDTKGRLAQVKNMPLMFMASEPDPLNIYLDEAAGLVPGSKKVLITRAQGLAGRVKAMQEFYDA